MYVFSLHTKCIVEFRYFHRISCWQFSTGSLRNAYTLPRNSDLLGTVFAAQCRAELTINYPFRCQILTT